MDVYKITEVTIKNISEPAEEYGKKASEARGTYTLTTIKIGDLVGCPSVRKFGFRADYALFDNGWQLENIDFSKPFWNDQGGECTYQSSDISKYIGDSYAGKILSLSECDRSEGDKRLCQNITLQITSGKVIHAQIGAGVKIYNNRGAVIYEINSYDSSVGMDIAFYNAMENLKNEDNIWVTVSCGGDSGCDIRRLEL